MLVVHITVLDETNQRALTEGKWETAPTQDIGDLSRALARTHGRNSGAMTAAVDSRSIRAGYKFDKQMKTEEAGEYTRVAHCLVGWKEGKNVWAYDIARRMPIQGTPADSLKLAIPETGYKSLPASTSPGRSRKLAEQSNAELVKHLLVLQKAQTEIIEKLRDLG